MAFRIGAAAVESIGAHQDPLSRWPSCGIDGSRNRGSPIRRGQGQGFLFLPEHRQSRIQNTVESEAKQSCVLLGSADYDIILKAPFPNIEILRWHAPDSGDKAEAEITDCIRNRQPSNCQCASGPRSS